jgi:(E)-4-hydroxy-3-methylbut-2-enyl-diphosphate synthase
MMTAHRLTTRRVRVSGVTIGGGAPVVVQAMTDTPTADVEATARQCRELAAAGAELVRIAVDAPAAAAAVPMLKRRLEDDGCPVPLIGDFHFNGQRLLEDHPDCAAALDKYRINPGNLASGARHDRTFARLCRIAEEHGKPIRIGVNGGSLDRDLVTSMMERNAVESRGMSAQEVLEIAAVESALRSVDAAFESGLSANRVVVSCKVSSPPELIRIYRRLARETDQPLHLGLTEAGLGTRGVVRSAAAMGTLLHEGIGDTIRVSLTPRPGGDRRDEVIAARELLQSLDIRAFAPTVTACPGCGRTTSRVFRELALRVEAHLEQRLPSWIDRHPGAESLEVAVMGCVVNGPGESKTADIGISLPGAGEQPRCPVYLDGELATTIEGDADELAKRFIEMIEAYVRRTFPTNRP